ncbi:MAG: VWA domain-containing protein [Candidatus Tectomicrobia bacterium]|nr:VWA domain-containing protein [Candidatus Tectomicrobia bacterium]
MIRYRYTIWDGSQEPFRPSPDDLLDGLTDHLLQDGDLHKALRDLMRRGMMDRQGNVMRGMQDVLNKVRATKEELLQQYNPDGVLSDLQRQLDDIVARERQALDEQLAATRQRLEHLSDDDPDAEQQRANEERAVREMEEIVAERQQTLDHLPRDVGDTIRQLQQYDFADSQAKADFEALVQSLQQQALDSLFQMMKQRLEQLTSDDLQRMRQMLEDLNDLLERRDMGEETDFQEFLDRYRDLFPDGTPDNLDDFLEQLARQLQAMQSLLNSMSEDMRQELQDLMQGQFDDARMQQALSDLMQHLQAMMQQHGLGDAFPFQGEESLSLQEALRLIERLQGLEGLEKQLEKILWGADPSQIDEQQVQELMDDETAGQVQTLKDIADHLEEQGYIRKSKDKLVLTARGVRKIAERAMRDIFASLRRDQLGKHPMNHRGSGGQRLEETKPYIFGDHFDVDLPRSMMNAVIRSPGKPPLRLAPQDFEVYRTESVSRCFTVLLLDMSGSMERSGRFAAAKKVALALDALIRTQFPRDSLAIVGFYTYAQEIALHDLPYLRPKPFGFFPYMYNDLYQNPMGYLDLQIDAADAVSGRVDMPQAFTNIQAGLQVAEHLLARQSTTNKQIILITDGEPTAHIRNRQICLEYPPSQRTLSETLKEVKRCTRQGITINTFMLGQDHYMERFVNDLTRVNRGRAFFTSPDNIGDYILVDYLKHRRKKIA